ncbi:MAG: Uma2 family endonuclease, partial [Nostoc sp. NMS1]|nr:Uma2 family endonuclease [Nostoc sp. NMS1]
FTRDGQLVPTPEETAEQAEQKAERLAAKLRELNIDPDTI